MVGAEITPKLRTVVGPVHAYTDEEYRDMRNAGITIAMEIAGTVYMPIGQTIAETPSNATRYSRNDASDTCTPRTTHVRARLPRQVAGSVWERHFEWHCMDPPRSAKASSGFSVR
jgi:hypothetical protein